MTRHTSDAGISVYESERSVLYALQDEVIDAIEETAPRPPLNPLTGLDFLCEAYEGGVLINKGRIFNPPPFTSADPYNEYGPLYVTGFTPGTTVYIQLVFPITLNGSGSEGGADSNGDLPIDGLHGMSLTTLPSIDVSGSPTAEAVTSRGQFAGEFRRTLARVDVSMSGGISVYPISPGSVCPPYPRTVVSRIDWISD